MVKTLLIPLRTFLTLGTPLRPPGVYRNECDKSRALILMILLWMFLRMEREIAQLKQRISESEGSVRSLSVNGEDKNNVNQSPVSPIQTLPTVLSIGDERCTHCSMLSNEQHVVQFYCLVVIWSELSFLTELFLPNHSG